MSNHRLALVLVAIAVAACLDVRPWRDARPPWTAESIDGALEVRAHRNDGSAVVLRDARVETSGATPSLEGTSAHDPRGERHVRVDLASVSRLETRRTEVGRVLGNVALGVSVAVVVFLLLYGSGPGIELSGFG